MATTNQTESRIEDLQSCEVAALTRYPKLWGCQIQPAWDGSGDYVLWAWAHAGRERRLLVHEDGAALRFPSPVKAHDHALKCGFRPEDINIRWPPDVRVATPFDA